MCAVSMFLDHGWSSSQFMPTASTKKVESDDPNTAVCSLLSYTLSCHMISVKTSSGETELIDMFGKKERVLLKNCWSLLFILHAPLISILPAVPCPSYDKAGQVFDVLAPCQFVYFFKPPFTSRSCFLYWTPSSVSFINDQLDYHHRLANNSSDSRSVRVVFPFINDQLLTTIISWQRAAVIHNHSQACFVRSISSAAWFPLILSEWSVIVTRRSTMFK